MAKIDKDYKDIISKEFTTELTQDWVEIIKDKSLLDKIIKSGEVKVGYHYIIGDSTTKSDTRGDSLEICYDFTLNHISLNIPLWSKKR